MVKVGSQMNRQEYYFGIPFLLLVFCILTALACAPAKVRVYPRETPPEKTIPPKTSSERAAQEKAAPEISTDKKPSPEEHQKFPR